MIPPHRLAVRLILLAATAAPQALRAQRPAELHLGLQAIGVHTSVKAIPGGRTLTEARVVQPVVMLQAAGLDGHLRFGPRASPLQVEPFLEATLGSAQSVAGGVLTPALLYGTTRVRSLSVGLLAGWGMAGHRMGRYGAMLETGHQPGMSHDHSM